MKKLVLACFVVACVSAPSATAHQIKHHHKLNCRHGFVLRHGKRHHVICVRRRHKPHKHTTPAPQSPTTIPPTVKLHAHIDPSFDRNPINPFAVTYNYSAAATTTMLAASPSAESPTEAPTTLPGGVLNLYNDGSLSCSINVGGNVTGGECPVTYKETGKHTVVVLYQSGEATTTETSTEEITPFGTNTALSYTYVPAEPAINQEYDEPHGLECTNNGDVVKCSCPPSRGTCLNSHVWLIGHLAMHASVTDEYNNALNAVASVSSTLEGLREENSVPVYGYASAEGPSPSTVEYVAFGSNGEEASRKFSITTAEIESGQFTATATFKAQPGYSGSTSSPVSIAFKPEALQ